MGSSSKCVFASLTTRRKSWQAAFSEVQFLNLIQERVDYELQLVGVNNEISLLNLQYIKKWVNEHSSRIAENITTLRARKNLDWPDDLTEPEQKAKAGQTARILENDFEYLLEQIRKLSQSCRETSDTLASNSIVTEAKKAEENSEDVRRLTIMASIFIPLSFTCSIFGMNFSQLGSGNLSIWLISATCLLSQYTDVICGWKYVNVKHSRWRQQQR